MSGRVTSHTCIYTDPDLDNWTAEAILLYQYLYSNDHVSGLTGIGRVSARVIASETRLTTEQISSAKKLIGDRVRWFDDGTYWVVARAKHTCSSSDGKINPKRAKGAYYFSCSQPETIRRAFQDHYRSLMGHIWPIDDPCVTHRPVPPVPPVTVSTVSTVNSVKPKDPPTPQGGGSVKEIALPKKFQRDDFKKAWKEWIAVRKAKGKVKDWTLLFQKQIEWLASSDAKTAIEIINQSIRNGWTGLFPIKDRGAPAIGQSTGSAEDRKIDRVKALLREHAGHPKIAELVAGQAGVSIGLVERIIRENPTPKATPRPPEPKPGEVKAESVGNIAARVVAGIGGQK